jgi:peptidoglycan/LPS O-acetylase OafA/YrhL
MRVPEIRPLTGLRALLALWVVLQHFVRELLPDGIVQRTVAGGHVAVHVFFVLSGYVLAVQYSHTDVGAPSESRAFLWRRFARLYPLYLCSLLLGLVAWWPGSWDALQTLEGAARGVMQLCVLNAWWHRAMFPLNFAAWTLSAEMFFYLLFPVLLPRLVRFSDRGLCLALGVATALTLVAPTLYTTLDPDALGHRLTFNEDHVWSRYLNFGVPHRVPEFVAGIAAALLVQRGWLARIRGSVVTALLAGTSLVLLASLPLIPFAYIGGSVLLPIIVMLVVSLDHVRSSWLASPPAVALGRASYATYILHVPYFFVLQQFGPHPDDMWQRPLDVGVYVATLFPVSLLARRWIEVPLQQLLTRASAGTRKVKAHSLRPSAIACPAPADAAHKRER